MSPPDGAVEVAAAGTGMMKMTAPYSKPWPLRIPNGSATVTAGMSEAQRSRFYQFFAYDDGETAEDYVFCQRWRDLGGSVWIEPEIELAHVGLKAWRGCYADTLADQAMSDEALANEIGAL